jgi:hypothetical protein
VQGTFHAGVGVVAAAQFEDGQRFAVLGHARLVAVGHRRLQAAQALLDRAQLAQGPVDDPLHGRAGRDPRVLREMADAAVGVDDDLSLVGLLLTGEQAQECRLAGPVLADDPGAFTCGERTRHRVQDEPAAQGLADGESGDLRGHAETPKHSRTGRAPWPAGPGERFGRASRPHWCGSSCLRTLS